MVQLGYFTLETHDLEKAKAFYGALFGWRFDHTGPNSTYAHVTDSDPAFGFTKVERARDFTHLYFRVDDVDALCVRVNELGGKAAVPSDSASGRSAVVCDDQGVSFNLWRPAAGY